MSVRDDESPIVCVCGETLHGLHQGVEYPTCPNCGESWRRRDRPMPNSPVSPAPVPPTFATIEAALNRYGTHRAMEALGTRLLCPTPPEELAAIMQQVRALIADATSELQQELAASQENTMIVSGINNETAVRNQELEGALSRLKRDLRETYDAVQGGVGNLAVLGRRLEAIQAERDALLVRNEDLSDKRDALSTELWICTQDRDQRIADAVEQERAEAASKTLHNSDISGARKNVPDIKVVGDGDTFKLVCKASSEAEGWMKSTKAMDVGHGLVIQVTTQQRNIDLTYSIAEAICYVPGVRLGDRKEGGRTVVEQ